MGPHDLNRIFEQLSPTPEQERAVLDRLLPPERKGLSMKKIKTLTAVLAAAALLAGTCAAMTATAGFNQRVLDYFDETASWNPDPSVFLNQQVLDYFGAQPEDMQRLSAALVPTGEIMHTYENGWTVQVRQVLSDRYSIVALMDFTAPEGTVLTGRTNLSERELTEEFSLYLDYLITDADGELIGSWREDLRPEPDYDEDGLPILYAYAWDHERAGTGIGWEEYLEDSEPEHGHICVMWTYSLANASLLGATAEITPRWLSCDSTGENIPFSTEEEDWSCRFILPETDSGRVYPVQAPLLLDKTEVELISIYLSPIGLTYQFGTYPGSSGYGYPLYDAQICSYALNLTDGTSVPMQDAFGHHAQVLDPGTVLDSQGRSFDGTDQIVLHPVRFIDPDEVLSFSLFGQTFELN